MFGCDEYHVSVCIVMAFFLDSSEETYIEDFEDEVHVVLTYTDISEYLISGAALVPGRTIHGND